MGVLQHSRKGVCKICKRQDEPELILPIIMKEASIEKIANQHKGEFSYSSLQRHFNNHVPPDRRRRMYAEECERRQIAADANATDRVERDRIDVIDSLKRLSKECRDVLKKSKDDGDDDMRLKAIAELRRQIELAARILGDLTETESGAISPNHPGWLRIRDVILTVLERHPAAKADFIKAIGAINGRGSLLR